MKPSLPLLSKVRVTQFSEIGENRRPERPVIENIISFHIMSFEESIFTLVVLLRRV